MTEESLFYPQQHQAECELNSELLLLAVANVLFIFFFFVPCNRKKKKTHKKKTYILRSGGHVPAWLKC